MREGEPLLLLVTFAVYMGATFLMSLRYWLRADSLIAAGLGALGAGFALHTGLLALRCLAAGRLPFSNLYEFTLVFAWTTLAVFLACVFRWRLLAAAPLVLAISTVLVGSAAMMGREIRPLMPALRSIWLQVHVATGLLAYGALAVSAALAAVAISGVEESAEPVDPASLRRYWRLPGKPELEGYIHGFIVFGFFFLSLLIVTGAVWAEETWGRWWGWDPKEAWALVTWLIYLAYLHGRRRFGWQGEATAWFSAVGFLAVLFTLFGVTYLLPGLHSYL